MYQSPISLRKHNVIQVEYSLKTTGKNKYATYDSEHRVFWVNDAIYLTHHLELYRLLEYHFHIQSEHYLHGKVYDAEIHYVFIKVDHFHQEIPHVYVCDGTSGNQTILVLGFLITNSSGVYSLPHIQVRLPHSYYSYDGTLTIGEHAPVRWIISSSEMILNVLDIVSISKSARPLQNKHHRIILYSTSSHL